MDLVAPRKIATLFLEPAALGASLTRDASPLQFTAESARSNVTRWETDSVPLDVWALDMNWRHTEPVQHPGQKGQAPGEVGTMDHYYDHPNERLFPGDGPYGSGFSEWFSWLESHKLRTYFNDRELQLATPVASDEIAPVT